MTEITAPAATASVPLLSLQDLIDASADPWDLAARSTLTGHPCLLVDLQRSPTSCEERVARFLESLPCPTIGIQSGTTTGVIHELASSLDIVVDDPRDLAAIVRNVTAHPLAAATLVQLLRLGAKLPIEAALVAESLAYATLQGSREFRAFLAQQRKPAGDDDAEPILIVRAGDVLNITLNRPARRNAYSAAMRDALYEALRWLDADAELKCAEVRGTGSCFCVGGEIAEFGVAPDPATAHALRMARPVGLLLHRLRDRLAFHVHRACIGSGIELPAFAGRVTATADTYFQLPEITMGLIPGAGGTVSIARRIGRQRLARWALSGRRIRAATALEWGLIDAIV